MRVWNPDSIHASARTRCGSTPSRADHESSFARTSARDGTRPAVATGTRSRWPRMIGFDGSILLARASAAIVVPWLFAIAVSVSPTRTTCTTRRRDDHAVHAHRNAVAPHDRRQRARTDDRVDVQMHQRLVAAQRRRRLLPHVAVERARVHAAPREQELQHRDVPAEVAAAQDPRAEERLAERAEREPRARVRRPDRQPVRRAGTHAPPPRCAGRRCRRSAPDRGRARAGRPATRRSAG